MTADPAAWESVGLQWRACLAEAWTSWCHRSLGVGAVIISPDGEIVARGRNREAEQHAPAGQLAGSYLAHAEINALAALPRRHHPGHRLLVTLAPCLVCASAIVMTQLPQLTLRGGRSGDGRRQQLARHLDLGGKPPAGHQRPAQRPDRHFARLLPVLHMAEHRLESRSFAVYQARQPGLVSQAVQFLADGTAGQLRDLPCHLAFGALALPADT